MESIGHDGASRLFWTPGWDVELLDIAGIGEMRSYHADVRKDGELMCRIALAGQFGSRAAAHSAVPERLRAWLRDYESRPHTGDSGFQIL
ncbi:hypothetical protein [Variovorax sp. PBL-E5]|uniref:hypothetical protein n=1 Tax=Variovorax sp. PBL-E5 TaxID=434014 RepID=UPI0013A598C4|nr:hypothetical protein [Variovorax sp. PBL-E5]